MYSYRNRERLVDRIKLKRQELVADGVSDSFVDDEGESSKTKVRPRRSGVHFNETDRKILEEALGAMPNPRDARTLARLWNQLESEVRCYLLEERGHSERINCVSSIPSGPRRVGKNAT